jgi:phosphopantetheinyl transferase
MGAAHLAVATSNLLRFASMDILEKITVGRTIVAVGHHQGKHEVREEDLQEDELGIVRQLSPRKRSEWLASRELLFKIAGLPERVQCLYDDFGKPYLKGIKKHISISHSELWCAAMISERPCGVDVQVYSDTVRRISERFLTPEDVAEVQKVENPIHALHLFWGAKECLYKAYGKRKLGFKEHIFISSLDYEIGQGLGEIRYEGIHLSYDIYFRFLPEVAWVFCMEHADSPSYLSREL